MIRSRLAALAIFTALPIVAPSAHAQGAVSPYTYENRVGNSGFSSGWVFARTSVVQGTVVYQEIHTDLRSRIQTISGLAFRQGPYGQSASAARTIDLDVTIGDSDFANRSRILSRNFVGTPTLVFGRKQVNLPDLTTAPASYPTPFTIRLTFDTPWSYTSQWDVCYQIRTYSSSAGPYQYSYAVDGVQMWDYNTEEMAKSGTGCWVRGRQQPMEHWGEARTYRAAAKHTFEWWAKNAPTGALSTFLIGLQNPVRYWPHLCTFQYVDNVFLTIRSFADGSGTFRTPTIEVPYLAAAQALVVYSQAYSLDPQQSPLIPVSATDGGALRIPMQPPQPIDIASYHAQGSVIGVADGYGMITLFF